MKFLFLMLAAVILASGCTATIPNSQTGSNPTSAETAVRGYFENWNNRNWIAMYGTISADFRKNETSAKDIGTFENFMESGIVKGVSVNEIRQLEGNSNQAKVYYSVEFTFANTTSNATGIFDLVNENGWKIVRPYS